MLQSSKNKASKLTEKMKAVYDGEFTKELQVPGTNIVACNSGAQFVSGCSTFDPAPSNRLGKGRIQRQNRATLSTLESATQAG